MTIAVSCPNCRRKYSPGTLTEGEVCPLCRKDPEAEKKHAQVPTPSLDGGASLSTNRARQIRNWPGPPEIHIHCMDRTCVVVERVGSSIALSTAIEGYHMLSAHLTKEQARNVIAVLRQVLDDIDARGHEGDAE